MTFVMKAQAACVAILLGSGAQAAVLIEDFSGGLNGWSAYETVAAGGAGGTPGGATVSHVTTGGPGGAGDAYIQYDDATANWQHAVFGNGWTGDLSLYDNGLFSIDFIESFGTANPQHLSFGTLRISGSGQSAVMDIVPANPTGSWQTASIAFNAAAFGVSAGVWTSILGNVSEIRFQTEAANGGEIVGLDNVTLTSPATVPLPAGGALLLAALGMLGLRRRG
ncbi:hypothetical protein [Tropicibacter sp. S64]|uniref:hypothetical protein n=1 Tax=Tropicibacter sp. S64 TaxID=3415122 RepID=UPI003C79B4E9